MYYRKEAIAQIFARGFKKKVEVKIEKQIVLG